MMALEFMFLLELERVLSKEVQNAPFSPEGGQGTPPPPLEYQVGGRGSTADKLLAIPLFADTKEPLLEN